MALAQVMHQVLDALGNAFALGINCLLLCFRIEGHEIAGRCGCHPLLHGKADAGTGFGISLHRISQAHHGAGVEHVDGGRIGCHRIATPCLARKTLVGHRRRKAVAEHAHGVLQILLLQCLQLLGLEPDVGLLGPSAWRTRGHGAQIHTLKRLHGLGPVFGHGLLELLSGLGQKIGSVLRHTVTFVAFDCSGAIVS